jgi:hypothetical protein
MSPSGSPNSYSEKHILQLTKLPVFRFSTLPMGPKERCGVGAEEVDRGVAQ